MTAASPAVRPSLRPVLWAAPLAAVINGAVFLLTRPVFEDVLVGPRQMPFSLAPILGLSVLGALGAGALYALLTRLTRQPRRVFASFLTPLSVPNVPVAVILLLDLMHVVVYAGVMALVPRRAEKGGGGWARLAPYPAGHDGARGL